MNDRFRDVMWAGVMSPASRVLLAPVSSIWSFLFAFRLGAGEVQLPIAAPSIRLTEISVSRQ